MPTTILTARHRWTANRPSRRAKSGSHSSDDFARLTKRSSCPCQSAINFEGLGSDFAPSEAERDARRSNPHIAACRTTEPGLDLCANRSVS